jgi:hypothetical protein
MSVSPEIPDIIEKRTRGTAMNFKSLMKIAPKGSIQFIVKEFHPRKLDIKAHKTPSTNPITILICSGRFFIY